MSNDVLTSNDVLMSNDVLTSNDVLMSNVDVATLNACCGHC